jgi:predicted DNA-binding ribbon-helix-helix protein
MSAKYLWELVILELPPGETSLSCKPVDVRCVRLMSGKLLKRRVQIGRQYVAIALEEAFWAALDDVAKTRRVPPDQLIADLERRKKPGVFLAGAIRLLVLEEYVARLRRSERRQATSAPTNAEREVVS